LPRELMSRFVAAGHLAALQRDAVGDIVDAEEGVDLHGAVLSAWATPHCVRKTPLRVR
jgi:hypothetical protein